MARLDARPGDGGAVLDGVLMGEGVIEVDLRGKNVTQQSFSASRSTSWTGRPTTPSTSGRSTSALSERAAGPLGAVLLAPGQHVAEAANRSPASSRRRSTAAGSGRVVPCPHRRRQREGPGLRGWRGDAVPRSGRPRRGEDRRRGAVGRQRSDGAFANLTITPTRRRAGAREPADDLPGRRDRQHRAAAGHGRRRRRRRRTERPDGLTPLHMAAMYEQRQAVDYLVANGADLNARRAIRARRSTGVGRPRPRLRGLAGVEGRSRHAPAVRRLDDYARGPPPRLSLGMMNNVLVFSGADGAIVVDSGFSRRAVDDCGRPSSAGRRRASATSSPRTRTAITSPATRWRQPGR